MFSFIQKYKEPSHAISWGYEELDRITSGIYPAELIVIGARPSVGKTQLMLDIAERVATQKKTVLFCSVEMSMEAILERRISREMGIGILDLRKKGLSGEQQGQLANESANNSERSIYYMSNGASSMDILNEATKMKEDIGLDIIFIDYLQFLKDCWLDSRENQNIRVGKASKTLKTIANELEVPVIVASQLSRALEHRSSEDKKPNLSDLRDSGNIEQDADVVFLLDREIIIKDNVYDDTNLSVKMAKNRQMGTAPAINLKYDIKTRRYINGKMQQPPIQEVPQYTPDEPEEVENEENKLI
jgi:replicative DNA helicase